MTPQQILKIEQDVVATLRNIYDPEIPVNIYDLGLIYDIDVEPSGAVSILMTLTAPTCPMADQLLADINREVGKVDGVVSVTPTITFDPPWDKSMMSEETLLELGLL
jgi:FeS assembly SUF system protein